MQVMCPTWMTAPCAPAPEMPPGSKGQVRGNGAGGRCQLGGCALTGAGTPGSPPVAFPFTFPQQEHTDGPSGCRTAAAATALPAVLPSPCCAAATTAAVVGRYGEGGLAGPGAGLQGRGFTRCRSLCRSSAPAARRTPLRCHTTASPDLCASARTATPRTSRPGVAAPADGPWLRDAAVGLLGRPRTRGARWAQDRSPRARRAWSCSIPTAGNAPCCGFASLCFFAGELWLLSGPGQSLSPPATVMRRARAALT